MLEEYLDRAKAGEIQRVGLMVEYENGCWGTAYSKSTDCRVDAAMMMELAIRRLGFAVK